MSNTSPQTGLVFTKKFVLRMRTPCLPCGSKAVTEVSRVCTAGDFGQECLQNERYILDTTKNDIVVNWQITGKCQAEGAPAGTMEDCGVIPMVKWRVGDLNIPEEFSSMIPETRINLQSFSLNNGSTPTFQAVNILTYTVTPLKTVIQTIRQPQLILSLNEKLISTAQKNVPYLEYQFLTTDPVSSSYSELTARVSVNGNTFEKIMYKGIKTQMIDFAVQN